MLTPDEVGLHDEVLARIPVYEGQELHLRRRSLAEPDIPVFLDLAQYNVQDGTYYLATPFRQDPDVVDQLIAALQHLREGL